MAVKSTRLKILIALTEVLQNITPTNGYDYDLSESVYRGRLLTGADMKLPALAINETPRSDSGILAGENQFNRKEEWALLMNGWVEDDKEQPTDKAYELMDAVEKQLAKIILVNDQGNARFPEFMLGNEFGIDKFVYGPGIVRASDEGPTKRAFFYLPLRITLATTAG